MCHFQLSLKFLDVVQDAHLFEADSANRVDDFTLLEVVEKGRKGHDDSSVVVLESEVVAINAVSRQPEKTLLEGQKVGVADKPDE